MPGQNGKASRKYREGNITATFCTDLLLQGITSIPSMLLRCYKRMGICDSEMMLLIHIIRIHSEEKSFMPSTEELGQYISGGKEQVERDLRGLTEKGMLSVTEYFVSGQRALVGGYDLEPLYEKVSELWAREKLLEIEEMSEILDAEPEAEDREYGRLFNEFSQEFGRPLSPIEAEQIDQWLKQFEGQIVREALRRAVLMGKHNFKYIDRILLEWGKNNLRTAQEVARYEDSFQKKRQKRQGTSRNESGRSKERDILKSLYL